MCNERLEAASNYIRKHIFPGWDRKKQWKILYLPELKKNADQTREKKLLKEIKQWGKEDEVEEYSSWIKIPVKLDVIAECRIGIHEIWVYEMPNGDDDLYLLLIHEICHAKAPSHYGKWASNMEMAHDRAVNLSDNLANLINLERDTYVNFEA